MRLGQIAFQNFQEAIVACFEALNDGLRDSLSVQAEECGDPVMEILVLLLQALQ